MELATLTQADLNDEGIKTQLTQNDLLEVIVEEKWKGINDSIDRINKRRRELSGAYENILNDLKKIEEVKFRKSINVPKDALVHTSINNDFNSRYLDIKSIFIGFANKKNYLGSDTSHSLYVPVDNVYKYKIMITITVNKKHEDYVKSTSYRKDLDLLLPANNAIAKHAIDIQNHNKEVEDMVSKYKDVNMSYDTIMRETRTTFNKRLIAGGAPKLRARVKDVFNIEL